MSNATDQEGEPSHDAAMASAAELESAVALLTARLREYYAKLRIVNSPDVESDKPSEDPYHTLDI
jgi:hypothetical protein